MTNLRAPEGRQVADPQIEGVRRELELKLRELQKLAASIPTIIPNIELVDSVATPIPHKLGRAPRFVTTSIVRGASSTGRIVESRSSSFDRSQVVVLTATGHGATITVDLAVL